MRLRTACVYCVLLIVTVLQVRGEWAVQPLDHADPSGAKFRQRFELNTSNAKGADAPVLVMVGGESALAEWQGILGGQVLALAAEFKAQVLSVEHRGFGDSVLGSNLSIETLSVLTPEQAALDLFSLHKQLVGGGRIAASARWVLFGCSYSGLVTSLAAGNVSLPSLHNTASETSPFAGAVCSSAPLAAHTAFEEYTTGLIDALGNPLAGGSAQCASSMQTALLWGGEAVSNATTSSWNELATTWQLCDTPATIEDAQWAWRYVVDYVLGFQLVQESRDYLIPFVCKTLLEGATPQKGLGDILSQINQGACGDVGTLAGFAAELGNITNDPVNWARQYFWLKCSVLGWFHACDDPKTCSATLAQSEPLPVSVFQRLCQEAFNLEPSVQAAGETRFNQMYGGRQPAVASTGRVQYVLGGADPWRALGAIDEGNVSFTPPIVTVGGGWHCSDMDPLSQYSPPAVIAARKAIQTQVAAWLE